MFVCRWSKVIGALKLLLDRPNLANTRQKHQNASKTALLALSGPFLLAIHLIDVNQELLQYIVVNPVFVESRQGRQGTLTDPSLVEILLVKVWVQGQACHLLHIAHRPLGAQTSMSIGTPGYRSHHGLATLGMPTASTDRGGIVWAQVVLKHLIDIFQVGSFHGERTSRRKQCWAVAKVPSKFVCIDSCRHEDHLERTRTVRLSIGMPLPPLFNQSFENDKQEVPLHRSLVNFVNHYM
mmetsp:Transcript_4937/g.17885  ORF Transcript_4937/g.17885 Transcript_4937/m.17885 type:complete len:238 (+) Transcript_4937:386-1099(+)